MSQRRNITALVTESWKLTSLTAVQMPLLPKTSLINSKAGTCLHPKLVIMDSEEESR